METIRQITDQLKNAPVQDLPALIAAFADDPRGGVQAAVERAQKRLAAEKAEDERLEKMLTFERKYAPYGVVCGIDEASSFDIDDVRKAMESTIGEYYE